MILISSDDKPLSRAKTKKRGRIQSPEVNIKSKQKVEPFKMTIIYITDILHHLFLGFCLNCIQQLIPKL